MRNKSNLFAVVLILLLAVSLFAFSACNPDNSDDNTKQPYDVPADLNVGISFFDGDATSVLGMVTKDTLAGVAQEVVTVDGTAYVAYKVSDLTAGFKTFPEITSVKFVSTDEDETEVTMTSFAASYIAIGTEENGAFKASSAAPVFIIDKDGTGAENIVNNVSKVYVNPEMSFAPTVIAAEDRLDLDTVTVSEVTVSDGETALFSFKKKDLAELDQYLVTLTAENKQYIGFKFTEIAAAKGAALPAEITEVQASNLSQSITSLDNAYVLVSKANDPSGDNTLNNIPRFVFDYATVTDMNSDVAKNVASIIINPVATEEPQETLLADLTVAFDGLTLTVTLDDISGATDDGTIVISTESLDAAVTTVTIGGKEATGIFADNRIKTRSTNDGDFYGYSLQDIIACLGKINNKGEFKPAGYTVSTVRFTVNEGDTTSESTVTVAGADMADTLVIDYTKDGSTRVYPASGSNVKNVVKISLYATAE